MCGVQSQDCPAFGSLSMIYIKLSLIASLLPMRSFPPASDMTLSFSLVAKFNPSYTDTAISSYQRTLPASVGFLSGYTILLLSFQQIYYT